MINTNTSSARMDVHLDKYGLKRYSYSVLKLITGGLKSLNLTVKLKNFQTKVRNPFLLTSYCERYFGIMQEMFFF